MELIDASGGFSHLYSPFMNVTDERQWFLPKVWDSYFRPPFFSYTEIRSGMAGGGTVSAGVEERRGFLEV